MFELILDKVEAKKNMHLPPPAPVWRLSQPLQLIVRDIQVLAYFAPSLFFYRISQLSFCTQQIQISTPPPTGKAWVQLTGKPILLGNFHITHKMAALSSNMRITHFHPIYTIIKYNHFIITISKSNCMRFPQSVKSIFPDTTGSATDFFLKDLCEECSIVFHICPTTILDNQSHYMKYIFRKKQNIL